MKPKSKAYVTVTAGAALELQRQPAKSNVAALGRDLAAAGSSAQASYRAGGSAGDGAAADARPRDEKLKAAEESMRMVVFLSCWGPN